MDKRQFLDRLDRELSKLPRSERETFLSYYDEMIEDKKEGGLTEEAAVIQAGDVKAIAKTIMEDQGFIFRIPSTGSKVLNGALLILGSPLWVCLLAALFLVVVAFYGVIWCVPFVCGVTGAALLGVVLFALITLPGVLAASLPTGIALIGTMAVLLGVSGLILLGTLTISKHFVKATVGITRKVMGIFRRREVQA